MAIKSHQVQIPLELHSVSVEKLDIRTNKKGQQYAWLMLSYSVGGRLRVYVRNDLIANLEETLKPGTVTDIHCFLSGNRWGEPFLSLD